MPTKTRVEEVEELVEAAKRKVHGDIIVKRFNETEEENAEWLKKFDEDLESYVGYRLELDKLSK